MKITSPLLALSVLIFLLLVPDHIQAAPEPKSTYKEISWENLLPESVSQKTLSADAAVDDKKLAGYLAERADAPSNPALQGRDIKIHGFVVPLERNDDSALTEFLLVPYFGACIHVPPPPQNQTIHVTLANPAMNIETMDTVFIYGKMTTGEASSAMQGAAYSIFAVTIEKDTAFSFSTVLVAGILTLFCGMSVSLGWVGPFAAIRCTPAVTGLAVAVAAGIMTCLGVSSVVVSLSWQALSLFLLGAAFMALGHFLFHHKKHARSETKEAAGFGPVLAIALHNFPECFIVFSSGMANIGLGFILSGAMIAHNIPLGLSLGSFSGKTLHRKTARMYAVIAGVVPPIAAIASYYFLKTWFSLETIRVLFACSGGALFFIALFELVPFARQYGERLPVFLGFSAGAIFMLSVIFFSYWG